MRWWQIALLILAALYLIGRLRLGAKLRYDRAGLSVVAIAGPMRFPVFPRREKPGKARKPKASRKRKGAQPSLGPETDQRGTLARVMDLLPTLAQAAGALRRTILIHQLDVRVIWGAPDPASAAIGFGSAHAAIGMIWPLFDYNFRVKRHHFQVEVDYGAARPEVELSLALTITLGQMLAFALWYGGKILRKLTGSRQRDRRKQEA